MDNSPTTTPPVPPQPAVQPAVSPPPESPNRRLLWFGGGLVLLIFGITIGLFSAKFLNQSPSLSQLSQRPPTPTPIQSPTPTPTPDLYREPTGSAATAGWKTYINSQYRFSFKHPDLTSDCCTIAGPLGGTSQTIAVFANKSTIREGTDKPFDGFGIYVDTPSVNIRSIEGFANYIGN